MSGGATAATNGTPGQAVPEPEFTILDVEAVRHAAAPALRFTAQVTEPRGREVYAIALKVQIMLEPAKRSYDDATRERLVELFGDPERWAATTRSFLWAELDVLVAGFTGATAFPVPMQCTYDLELAAAKYLHSLPGGHAPLAFNFTGTIFYRADEGRMQIVKVPWDSAARYEMPVSTWREMMDHYYPGGGWVRLDESTLGSLGREKARRGLPSFDATVAAMLAEDGEP